MSDLQIGSDGEVVRVVGPWSEEKLFYIGRYIEIFTTGMKRIWPRRVYIDLFSGPGQCVIEDTDREILGSPLLALKAKYPFTHAYLNDSDPQAVHALRRRIGERQGLGVTIANLDCNAAAVEAVDQLELDAPGTLGLAVIDPTAFQISLSALEEMTRGRKIDLIVTLMTGYLRRFLAEPNFQRDLDAFFGGSEWRALVDLREAGGRVTLGAFLDLYGSKLKAIGYTDVDNDIRLWNSREQTIYHLVFATKSERGADFFKKISARRFSGQQRLSL